MRTIAEVKTYNPYDCTSVGYAVRIRDDGYMRVQRHSRWQGSLTGEAWIARAPRHVMEAARAGAPELKFVVEEYLTGAGWKEMARRIRRGYRVR